ncbi:hypothetical protein, partial [Pseudomonas sp. EA_105y_Pfl2_R69]|uniref:hypothetical protein n=1 Tax=Pseudomonas sp. EA_105y_Pfl2_R69 TaxID=3088683 RepID=UPI0030DA4174
FAQRGPSVQSITQIIIVIGLIPLQDSPVPTVLLLTTTTRKPSRLTDYPAVRRALHFASYR